MILPMGSILEVTSAFDDDLVLRMSSPGKVKGKGQPKRFLAEIYDKVRASCPTVYKARLRASGKGATKHVALKIAAGMHEADNLEWESYFYKNDLRELQGSVVPIHYGFFRTSEAAGKKKGACAVMVTELCDGWDPESHFVPDAFEINRRKLAAVFRLHRAGIMHTNLVDDSQEHFVAQGNDFRIVGFTNAIRHRCEGCVSIPRPYDDGRLYTDSHSEELGCPELYKAAQKWGILSPGGTILLAAEFGWNLVDPPQYE